MDDLYHDINDYNPTRNRKILIVFDDIADIMTNKKFYTITRELFIGCRKMNIFLVFTTRSYFSVEKKNRLNSTSYLIMKIHNKRKLQQIAISHSAEIYYKDFMNIYGKCTSERSTFLTIDITLKANNSLRFSKNVLVSLRN